MNHVFSLFMNSFQKNKSSDKSKTDVINEKVESHCHSPTLSIKSIDVN